MISDCERFDTLPEGPPEGLRFEVLEEEEGNGPETAKPHVFKTCSAMACAEVSCSFQTCIISPSSSSKKVSRSVWN
jgi:hypothetical protein